MAEPVAVSAGLTTGTYSPIRRALIVAAIFVPLIVMAFAVHHIFFSPQQNRTTHLDHRPTSSLLLNPSTFASIPKGGKVDRTIVAVEETASAAPSLQNLSAEDAQKRNAAIPVVTDVGPTARPLRIPITTGPEYARAVECMTAAIYYEAANEPVEGQRGVAQVVINRSRHFAYPHSICSVVYQGWERSTGCQFSFTCDGSVKRAPVAALWQRARRVAVAALGGFVYAPVGLATHYHADYVLPYWGPTLVKLKVIGRHIFYRWPGQWGTPRSFVASYDRNEPDIWADMQMAGIDSPGTSEALNQASVPADMASRPVLVAGGVPTPTIDRTQGMPDKNRVYLMSRAPAPGKIDAAADIAPAPRRGVTGGVIMPAASASVPAATARPIIATPTTKPNG